MKKITFDFLKTMEVKEVDKPAASAPVSKIPAPGSHLRLFPDGSVYPSAELVALHSLEFQPQGSAQPENGYDVFTSSDWEQYGNSSAKAQPFVCLALVSKHHSKVSLFSQTKYNADQTPKSSVLTQKTNSGEELIQALKAVYLDSPDGDLFEGKAYLDLIIGIGHALPKTATGIYHIPKQFQRGKEKGKPTYVRRENISVFPVIIAESQDAPAAPSKPQEKKEATAPKTQPVTPQPAAEAKAPTTPVDAAQAIFGSN